MESHWVPAYAGTTDKFFISGQSPAMDAAWVYILASQRNGTLYVGVTSDLPKRIWQHKQEQCDGFTSKYDVKLLVYFERHERMLEAITREKQIKKWNRAWKLRLIETGNPEWRDLFNEIVR